MTENEVSKLILDIIHDIAPDEDLSDVKPEVRLRDQLDLDSMDFLDIVMELRKRHQIEVPEAELRRRLRQRWVGFGLTEAQIDFKLDQNDVPNGRVVLESSGPVQYILITT